MSTIVFTLAIVALLATLGVLFAGLLGMARGGEFNRKYGNKLMRWRVAIQGSAVLLLLLAMYLANR